jgi:hypothetical protein
MLNRPADQIADYIARFASPPAEQVKAFIVDARKSVHSGIIRYMLIVPESGDDVTKDFSVGPTFALSFGSAVSGQSARIGIAAVTDCVVSTWPFKRLTALFESHADWQKLGRVLAERLYVRKEDREIAFLTQTPEERFAGLAESFPNLSAQVPQRHLASYLGITPESLSRLKARLAARA